MGGICPLHMGGTSAGGQSVNGGRLMRGDLTLIDYIKITQCNLLAAIVLKLVDLYLMAFKFA